MSSSLINLPIELIDLIFDLISPSFSSTRNFTNDNNNNDDDEVMDDQTRNRSAHLKDFLALRSVHPNLYRTYRSEKIFLKSVAEGQLAICRRMLLSPPAAGSIGPDINPAVKNNEAIILSCRNGFYEIAKLLLEDQRVNPGDRDQEAIIGACEKGHASIVGLLVQGPRKGAVNAACRHNEPIKITCLKGFIDIADILLQLPYVDPGANRNQALLNACRNGHTSIIKKLVQKCPQKCDFSVQNSLPLQVAVSKGDLELVQSLLAFNQVNPGAWDSAAFRDAVKNGFLEIAKVLAMDPRVNVAAANNKAISDAAGRGYIDLVKLLLSDSKVDPSAQDNAALKSAVSNGHLEVTKLLFRDARVNPTAKSLSESFVKACMQGFHEIVGVLLSKTADPSLNDSLAFRVAAANGHIKIVEMLLDDGRINPTAGNHEAFTKACSNGHVKVVRLLMQISSTDPGARDNEAIKQSAIKGYTDIVKILLTGEGVSTESENAVKKKIRRSVDPSVNYSLPLRKAASHGFTEIVQALLKDGHCDASACDNEAIKQACKYGYHEIVDLLLKEPRVNPDIQCLKDACENGHIKVVQVLLADGRIDPLYNENYALHLAMQNRHYDIVRLLQNFQNNNNT